MGDYKRFRMACNIVCSSHYNKSGLNACVYVDRKLTRTANANDLYHARVTVPNHNVDIAFGHGQQSGGREYTLIDGEIAVTERFGEELLVLVDQFGKYRVRNRYETRFDWYCLQQNLEELIGHMRIVSTHDLEIMDTSLTDIFNVDTLDLSPDVYIGVRKYLRYKESPVEFITTQNPCAMEDKYNAALLSYLYGQYTNWKASNQ